MTPEKDLQDKKINEVFDDEFLSQTSGYIGKQCLHLCLGQVQWNASLLNAVCTAHSNFEESIVTSLY